MHRLTNFTACLIMATIAVLALMPSAVKAQVAAPTSYATGALMLSKGGDVTTLAGYTGKITGIGALHYRGAVLTLNGFVGAGSPSTNKQLTYGAAIGPSIAVGSLAVGVGAFEDVENWSTHLMVSVSFSLN